MHIVIEELYGITASPFSELSFEIKATKVGHKEQSLRDLIAKTKPGFFTKQLPLQPTTFSEELAYFQALAETDDTILYVYDPSYTSVETLYRVRNILLPDKKLIPISFDARRENKAELVYIIYMLAEWYTKQAQHLTYEKFLLFAQYYKSQCTPWSIVADTEPFSTEKKYQSVYAEPKKQVFKHVYLQDDGKWKVHKSGALLDLWTQMIAVKTATKKVWVVRKGVSVDLPGADFVLDLDNQTLPVQIPYIHAIFVPEK